MYGIMLTSFSGCSTRSVVISSQIGIQTGFDLGIQSPVLVDSPVILNISVQLVSLLLTDISCGVVYVNYLAIAVSFIVFSLIQLVLQDLNESAKCAFWDFENL